MGDFIWTEACNTDPALAKAYFEALGAYYKSRIVDVLATSGHGACGGWNACGLGSVERGRERCISCGVCGAGVVGCLGESRGNDSEDDARAVGRTPGLLAGCTGDAGDDIRCVHGEKEDPSVLRGLGDSPVISAVAVDAIGGRGPNWARNNEWRIKKKRAKALRRGAEKPVDGEVSPELVAESDVPLWRRKTGRGDALVPEAERKGYFSGLPDEVLLDLKESRARALILRNKREAVEEQRRLDFADSSMFLVQEAVRAMEMSERASKLAVKPTTSAGPDTGRVAGWAQTVASSYATSVAKSAPSSVPSLASITSVGSSRLPVLKDTGKLGYKGKSGGSVISFDPVKADRNSVEKLAVKMYFVSEGDLLAARKRCGRPLIIEDFIGAKSPFRLSKDQMYDLISSEIEGEEVCGRSYGL